MIQHSQKIYINTAVSKFQSNFEQLWTMYYSGLELQNILQGIML